MVGVDIARVDRMRDLLARYPRAEERFFTPVERAHCRGFTDPSRHFAGTFAAKEAVVKALRLGHIGAWLRQIEIARDASGAPTATVRGRRREVALSISHEVDTAVAVAVALPERRFGFLRRLART